MRWWLAGGLGWGLVFFPVHAAVAAISVADSPRASLPEEVLQLLRQYSVPASSLSVYVQAFDDTRPLLATHIDTLHNPASVMKLVVSFAALDLLGPGYTWETQLLLDGVLRDDGILDGNLELQGSGDPFLSKETFREALVALQSRGLRHIKGDLIIDNSLFPEETGSPGDFDNNPYRAYNTFPSATLLNFHAHYFHIIPQGAKALVYADPAASNLSVRNALTLGNGPCTANSRKIGFQVMRTPTTTRVTISGRYPRQCGDHAMLRAVLPDDEYVFGVFKAMWSDLGGTISGKGVRQKVSSGRRFYTIHSRTLGTIVNHVNRHSNNVMARQLLLTLARERGEDGHGKAAGEAVVRSWLYNLGIPVSGLIIDNGSGLSRHCRITARTLALLLDWARRSPYQPEFFSSLAANGWEGTMKRRLRGDMAPGQARVKTGLLRGVRTLAGVVRSKSQRDFIVVSLHSYPGVQNRIGTRIQDALLKWVHAQ